MTRSRRPDWRERAVSRSLDAARIARRGARPAIPRRRVRARSTRRARPSSRSRRSSSGRSSRCAGSTSTSTARTSSCSRCSRRPSAKPAEDIRGRGRRRDRTAGAARAFAITLHEWCDPGEAPRKRGHAHPPADLRVLDASGRRTTPIASAPRCARRPACCVSSSTTRPTPGAIDRRRPSDRDRARAADGDVQLVRQPPGGDSRSGSVDAEATWEFCRRALVPAAGRG